MPTSVSATRCRRGPSAPSSFEPLGGILTVSFDISRVMMIWHASREVRVAKAARSSRSSSSSLAGGKRLKSSGSTMTWHVEQAITPSHAPSRGSRAAQAMSSSLWPASASTSLSSVPSALRKRTRVTRPVSPGPARARQLCGKPQRFPSGWYIARNPVESKSVLADNRDQAL